MLAEVRESLSGVGVPYLPHIHIDCGRCLVSLFVVDEEHLHLVGEAEPPVRALGVGVALLDRRVRGTLYQRGKVHRIADVVGHMAALGKLHCV